MENKMKIIVVTKAIQTCVYSLNDKTDTHCIKIRKWKKKSSSSSSSLPSSSLSSSPMPWWLVISWWQHDTYCCCLKLLSSCSFCPYLALICNLRQSSCMRIWLCYIEPPNKHYENGSVVLVVLVIWIGHCHMLGNHKTAVWCTYAYTRITV